MNLKTSLLALGFLFFLSPLFAQTTDTFKYVLTLDEVIAMAIEQSSAIKYVQNQNVNYYWRYRNFKTRFRPQAPLPNPTGVLNLSKFQTLPHPLLYP
jgi:hypothetical protein